MFITNKFYDAIATDGGATTDVAEPIAVSQQTEEKKEPVNEIKAEVEPPKEKVSIAALMAKKGVKTNSSAAKPIANKETKEEAKATDVTPVETTTETPKAEAAKPESQLPLEKGIVAQPQKEEAIKPETTWQEVLRSQQPNNVLKELGFDDKTVQLINELKNFDKIDFFTKLVNTWKSKGDIKEYLTEMSTDYAKMAAEDVMRHQLRAEYKKASDQQIEVLFKKEIVRAFGLDSEDPDEVEEGKMLLDAKADKYRDEMVERQKTKLFPEVPEPAAEEPDNREQIAKEKFEKYKSTVLADEFGKSVFDNKKIVIGEGEKKFSYSIDDQKIKDILFDSDKWLETQFNVLKNDDGETVDLQPKVRTQLLTAAFASDPDNFLKEYANFYQKLGGKKSVESIDNAKMPNEVSFSKPEYKPTNPAQAMARNGRLVPGGV